MKAYAINISSWVRKVLGMVLTHTSLGTLQGAAALIAGVSLLSTLPADDGPEFLLQPDTIFSILHYYRLAPESCVACCPVP